MVASTKEAVWPRKVGEPEGSPVAVSVRAERLAAMAAAAMTQNR